MQEFYEQVESDRDPAEYIPEEAAAILGEQLDRADELGGTMTFEEIQIELAILKPQLDKYKVIKRQYDSLREAAQYEMLSKGIKSTLPVNGYSIVLAERITPVVTDPEAALTWLADNYSADDYLKIDEAKVAAIAQQTLKETGEIIPGIEEHSTVYTSVKRSK